MESIIVTDIWGGELHLKHVARYLRPFDEAIEIARDAIAKGFLVNMRSEIAWGTENEWDERKAELNS